MVFYAILLCAKVAIKLSIFHRNQTHSRKLQILCNILSNITQKVGDFLFKEKIKIQQTLETYAPFTTPNPSIKFHCSPIITLWVMLPTDR